MKMSLSRVLGEMDGFEYWLQRSVQVCIAWSSGASKLQDATEMVGNESV